MKKLFLLLLLMGGTPDLAEKQAANADPAVSLSLDNFYDALSPFGEWLEVGAYGTCWRPNNVDADWAPYVDGYWAYTDAGWTWVSYEEFGDITYHYGRWARVEGLGWIWQPGYEWAPAWVSWRSNDDYVGWAPLPPEVVFNNDSGISVWVDTDYDIGPGYYNFCEARNFGSPVLRNVIVPRERNIFFISNTLNVTNIYYQRDRRRIWMGGPDYHHLSRRSDRYIETLRLEHRHGGHSSWRERNRRHGDQFIIRTPMIVSRPERKPKVTRRVADVKIDRGWRAVADANERKRVYDKMRDEVRGKDRRNSPAREVNSRAFEEAERERNERRERRKREEERKDRRDDRKDDRRDDRKNDSRKPNNRDDSKNDSRKPDNRGDSKNDSSKPDNRDDSKNDSRKPDNRDDSGKSAADREQQNRERQEAANQKREEAERREQARERQEALKQKREEAQRQEQQNQARQEEVNQKREEAQRREQARERQEALKQRREEAQRQEQQNQARQEEVNQKREEAQRREQARERQEALKQRREEAQRQEQQNQARQEAANQKREEAQRREQARERQEAARQKRDEAQRSERSRPVIDAVKQKREEIKQRREERRERQQPPQQNERDRKKKDQ